MQPLKYELVSLLRDKWILILSMLLLVLCLFAAFNGQQKVDKRLADIDNAFLEMNEGDAMAKAFIDSVNAGFEMNTPSWTRPDKATAIGNYHPRVAAMPPSELAVVATGQSDLYTHYVKPTISGDEIALNFTELTSPVQLLFGTFDLAFVLIYLLPLIVIAFSYNMLSAEREQGSLRLLASQPISVAKWLVQKAGLRFAILGTITIISVLLSLLVLGTDLSATFGSLSQMTLLIISYLVFWFSMAILVNLGGKTSANNAVSLLALWVVFVLLIPSTVNQMATSLYPAPARSQMINDMRVIKAEATKKQDEILDAFLRDHPELMLTQNNEGGSYNWWSKYFASKELVKEEMAPMVADFETQLNKQQNWVKKWRFISPAMLLQGSFNHLAGTSTGHYEAYRDQVIAFSEEWRNFLLPLIFHDRPMTTDKIAALPQFTYDASDVPSGFITDLGGINMLSLLLVLVMFYAYRKRVVSVHLG